MVKSKHRGHKMELSWIYSDTKNLVSSDKDRACGKCNQPNTKEGHDPCLGTLKNAMNACCGHGNLSEAFVQLPNGFSIRGLFSLITIELLKHS
jgi:hypothetical protein